MRRVYVLPLMLAGACTIGCDVARTPEARADQKPPNAKSFALEFDGGFAYLMSGSKVDVAGVSEVPGMPQHRLRIGVRRAALYDAKATTLAPRKVANFLTWDLTGYDAVIAPGGTVLAGNGLKLPAGETTSPECGSLEEDSQAANRLQHLVDLAALHPTATLNEEKIASTLALTDGEFRIRRAGYCWQLERGEEKRAQGRLVQGVLGMNYRVDVAAPYVDIKLAKRGSKDYAQTIRLVPGADGAIAARVSTAFNDMKTTVRPGDLDPHFDMFYALLKFPTPSGTTAARSATTDAPYKARYVVKLQPDSPGDDCLSVRFGPAPLSASRTLQ